MRLLTVAILALCLLLAGYAAAALRMSDTTTAQSTWQFDPHVSLDDMDAFVAELPADCQFDWEPMAIDWYAVAYSCPD